MFMLTLMLGALMAISSNSWLSTWLGLELNLLSFIPIITSSSQNIYSSESALKYFLIQALGSITILGSASALILVTFQPSTLILMSLLLKMGAAPVHFWFPSIVQGMSWWCCFVLMTIQKIAPLCLISFTLTSSLSLVMVQASSIISSIIGSVGGLNQTLLRKLMAYSSINHMAWMLAATYLNNNLFINYLMIYSLILLSIISILNPNKIFHFNQMNQIPSSKLKIMSMLSMLSLGGLPPFLGFLPKLMIINLLTLNNQLLWIMILLTSALITLFFYIRLSMTSLSLSSPQIKVLMPPLGKGGSFLPFLNLSTLLFPLLMLL